MPQPQYNQPQINQPRVKNPRLSRRTFYYRNHHGRVVTVDEEHAVEQHNLHPAYLGNSDDLERLRFSIDEATGRFLEANVRESEQPRDLRKISHSTEGGWKIGKIMDKGQTHARSQNTTLPPQHREDNSPRVASGSTGYERPFQRSEGESGQGYARPTNQAGGEGILPTTTPKQFLPDPPSGRQEEGGGDRPVHYDESPWSNPPGGNPRPQDGQGHEAIYPTNA